MSCIKICSSLYDNVGKRSRVASCVDSLTQELILAQIVTIGDKRLLIIIEKTINILI